MNLFARKSCFPRGNLDPGLTNTESAVSPTRPPITGGLVRKGASKKEIIQRNHRVISLHSFLVAHAQSTCNFSRVSLDLLHFFSPYRISNAGDSD